VIQAKLDTGSSATDSWVLDITISDDYWSESVSIVWDYSVSGGMISNTLTIAPQYGDAVSFISEWNPDRGDFRLAYRDRWDTAEFRGNLTISGRGFRLLLDDLIPYNVDNLSIEIIGELGANIRRIDYINIDRWDMALFERLGDFIMGLGIY